MKKLILLILFLNLYLVAYNQIIKGSVLDKETKSPIGFAYLYFNGTSTGTQSDQNGNFELDVSKNTANPLTISAIGYYSSTLSDYLIGKPLAVYLDPKVFELNDINIGAKSLAKKRKANLTVFKNVFLGTNDNAQNCEILNQSDIKFNYDSDRDTLIAYATKPLLINNRVLGYKITYYLDKFEYIKNNQSYFFQGNIIFKEDLYTNETQKQTLESRRKYSYLGSRMHFFRALWLDELESNGFSVKNAYGRNLSAKDIVIQDASNKKYLRYKGSLGICYYSDVPFSHLEIQKDRIYFDKNGYFDSFGIIWEGYMADKKIADMLPFDYLPTEKAVNKSDTIFKTGETLSANQIETDTVQESEKVYLHTDRDFYNPGDDIWFKSYVVDALTHKPSNKSKNLHVELITSAAKIIDRRILRLNDGLGNGDFTLPNSIQSGQYSLRAYTNNMRNFSDQIFFNKEINIVNGSDTTGVPSDSIKYSNSKLEIDYFPEGGSLVDNVSSIVAFKAVDAAGLGCNVSGEIYSSTGDTITTFRSTHRGMGTFTFKPVRGSIYYAIVKRSDGDLVKCEIPKSYPTGVVLSTSVNQNNKFAITLKTNTETLPLINGHDLKLTISTYKNTLKTLSIKIDSLYNNFVLPIEDLPDGIIIVTIFGPDRLPLCERLIYVQNNGDIKVKIEPSKTVYKQRDSVSVKLTLLDDSGIGQEAFLSLSTTEKIYTDRSSKFPSTISSWFLLESDVRGPIEEPSYYFDQSNPDRLKNLDLLLLTQGWRDFEWKSRVMKYMPESGFTISGRLRKLLVDVPLKNHIVTIGIFQAEKSIITNVSTDSTGRFSLDLENLSGSARLIVSATDQKGNFQGRIILDSLDYSPAKIQTIKKNRPLNENLTLLREADEIKKSIRKKYTLSDTILIDEVRIYGKRKETPRESHVNQSRMVYGQPDKEVIITPELESFRSIKDLLIGRVAGIYPIQQGSGIRIRGYGSSFEMSSEPLFVLNGVVVSYAEISSIPFSWIDRIDVIMSEKAAAFGVRGANGVISVITKTSENITYKPTSYSLNSQISGYDAPRIFYSPKHSSTFQTGYMPDLRSTLYWFPDIKVVTNKAYILKYFNGDISSTFKIVIEGITSSGIPVTGKVEYEVK